MPRSREWRHQLIALTILVVGFGPVAWLDASTLEGHGRDWISLDLRGLYIMAYAIWVAAQLALTSAIVAFSKLKNVLVIHVMVAMSFATVLFMAFLAVS